MTDTGTKGDLRLWNYDSNFDIFGSDHRPVYA